VMIAGQIATNGIKQYSSAILALIQSMFRCFDVCFDVSMSSCFNMLKFQCSDVLGLHRSSYTANPTKSFDECLL